LEEEELGSIRHDEEVHSVPAKLDLGDLRGRDFEDLYGTHCKVRGIEQLDN
jgi:hypothetical protein